VENFMNEWSNKVEQLKQSIDDWRSAYQHPRLSLVAVKKGAEYFVLAGQLALRTDQLATPAAMYDFDDAFGCAADLSGIDEAFRLLDAIRAGQFVFKDRRFVFPPGDVPAAVFEFLHKAGSQDGRRLTAIRLLGATLRTQFDRQRLDWQLKAASPPMESIDDLALECGIRLPDEVCTFECVALNVITIAANSSVVGTKATIRLVASDALDLRNVRLGYKVFHKGGHTTRALIEGGRLSWQEGPPSHSVAAYEFDVPPNAVIHAFASYGREAQQKYWVLNPVSTNNPRLAVFAHIDKELRVLEAILNPTGEDRREATTRQFEAAVGVLSTLVGFSAISLGKSIPQLQDAPDHILVSPAGDFVVLECTTSHIDKNDKLTQLFGRAKQIRAVLNEGGFQSKRLLATLVTALAEEEIAQSDLEKARQLGISVITKQDLRDTLRRARNGESAQQMFEEGVNDRAGSGQLKPHE
jgi:hypothetical protein